MNMNISTGGPHILFFERDTSLMALLISEFQLAGYECHTARTAVEVFDAIARHSIRAVLVDMAQAAAGRREFWVALDAQRRGRGVQVFTYKCYNLASYGPREADERSSATNVDVEINGMLGLMNLVERIRERVPVNVSTTGTVPKFSRTASSTSPAYGQQADGNGVNYRNGAAMNAQLSGQDYAATRPITAIHAATQPSPTPTTPPTSSGQQSYSEKIRAVLYSPQRAASVPAGETMNGATQAVTSATAPEATTLQQLAYGRVERDSRESGLAQLSRLVQEYRPPLTETNVASQRVMEPVATPVLRASPIEDLPVDRLPMSPVTGEPVRRSDMGTRTAYVTNGNGQYGYVGQQEINTATPLASITAAMPVIPATPPVQSPVAQPAQIELDEPANPTIPIAAVTAPDASTTQPAPTTYRQERQEVVRGNEEVAQNGTQPSRVDVQPVQESPQARVAEPQVQSIRVPMRDERTEAIAPQQMRQDIVYTLPQTKEERHEEQAMQLARDKRGNEDGQELALADIIQSFPASLSSSPAVSQTPVVNGRTIRSLGTVLLEGHLVPQSRLEVAQNIQRMLRGVDLRYELGEILLMFKLLTPDQLLAATLVSYGLITAQQISALSRIRQELHSIGLEYDLESLLILFRMLTPEQLREARTNGQI